MGVLQRLNIVAIFSSFNNYKHISYTYKLQSFQFNFNCIHFWLVNQCTNVKGALRPNLGKEVKWEVDESDHHHIKNCTML